MPWDGAVRRCGAKCGDIIILDVQLVPLQAVMWY
jgi:hypothetical protein